ncbi:MAG TPA: peptidoglycan editing factor PgeF [Bryobacteraceae bacterium]|nr:peptidoglycan editing factor PgeF [Bryobacteraceae bacterium]
MPVLQSPLLAALPWVTHGFGVRSSENWIPDYTNLKQIHSSKVVVADGRRGSLEEGDALITSEAGNWIGIRTADCVPILIADPENRVAAAIHAGWRGTVASIVRHAVEKMTQDFRTDPGRLLVAIGPAIGPCCFEVGPEVAQQFHSNARTIDLATANSQRLIDAGVALEHIEVMRLCTVCSGPGQFHSFRRDKEQSGRMVSAICIGFGDEKSAGGEPALWR